VGLRRSPLGLQAAAWVEYHRAQVERHRATLADLIAHHEAEAERLVPGTGGGVGS
jgi:hypothetical protein